MDLFSGQEKYTIDLCSLREMFDPNRKYWHGVLGSLLADVEKSIADGIVISHIEVLKEIKKGGDDELSHWVSDKEFMFKDYDSIVEAPIVSDIGSKYPGWVAGSGLSSLKADPWLIAQAKGRGLTVITEEILITGSSPKEEKLHIPNVCKEYGVKCFDLFSFIKEMGWKY